MAIFYTPENAAEIAKNTGAFTSDVEYVLGFAVWTWDGATRMETLYALDKNGKVRTWTGKYSCDFNPRGRVWVECSVIPLEAEFIGHYIKPAHWR